MKNRIFNILAMIALVMGFTACDPDTEPQMDITKLPELNSLASTTFDLASIYDAVWEDEVVASQFQNAQTTTITWTKGQFGFAAGPLYELYASDTKDFKNEVLVGSANGDHLVLINKNVNKVAIDFQPQDVKDAVADGSADSYQPISLFLRLKCCLNDVKNQGYGDSIMNAAQYYAPNTLEIVVTPWVAKAKEATKKAIFLVGTPNDWDITSGQNPLYETEKDVYVGVVTLKAGADNYFRFYGDIVETGDDGLVWNNGTSLGSSEFTEGSDLLENLVITDKIVDGKYSSPVYHGKGNWVVGADKVATYTMTVDINNMTFTMEEGGSDPSTWKYIYCCGDNCNWNIDAGNDIANRNLISKDGSNIYKGEINFTKADGNSYFAFFTALQGQGDWGFANENRYGSDTGEEYEPQFENGVAMETLGKSEKCFFLPKGKYMFEVNLDDMVVTITKVVEE